MSADTSSTPAMRKFGSSDLAVTLVGMGTWPIGGARYGGSEDAAAIRAIHAALDSGVSCFDTAPSYGNGHAEEILGQALKTAPGFDRGKVTIVTKGGLLWDEKSNVLGRCGKRDYLIEKLDESLRRLQTDYVDLYLIHWPDLETPLQETMEALEEIVASGRARYVGVSNFTGEQLREAARFLTTTRLVANQIGFHLFDRRWANASFDACDELGVGVMAYGPLAHGLLSGAFTRGMTFEPTDWRASGMIFGQALLTPGNFERNLDVVDRLTEIARDIGTTLPRLAIAWVLSHPTVTVALVGARNEAEMADAVAAALVELDGPTLAAINEAMQGAAGLSDELPT